MHITDDSTDPRGAAHPIGYKVPGKYTDASHAPGMRISTIETILWTKER